MAHILTPKLLLLRGQQGSLLHHEEVSSWRRGLSRPDEAADIALFWPFSCLRTRDPQTGKALFSSRWREEKPWRVDLEEKGLNGYEEMKKTKAF